MQKVKSSFKGQSENEMSINVYAFVSLKFIEATRGSNVESNASLTEQLLKDNVFIIKNIKLNRELNC